MSKHDLLIFKDRRQSLKKRKSIIDSHASSQIKYKKNFINLQQAFKIDLNFKN
jgi:hypothetical protein